MTKKIRTILFFSCLFLFILIAPSAIFYSLGYRFDFDSRKIVQTGAFYFRVWPKNAQIYLDGRLKKKADFLFGSVFIDNLLPKKYLVEIKKEGYLSWKKTLEVKEKEVTESKNVFLIPENPKFESIDEKIEDFFFSPDGKKIIFKKNGNLEFLDLEKNKKELIFEGNEISNLTFSQDSKRIFFKTGGKNLIFEFKRGSIPLDFLEKVEKISFNPKTEEKIFFLKGSNLFEANFKKREINFEPILKDLITYQVSDSNLFWISKNGFLFKTDFSGKIEEKLSFEPFPLKEDNEYQIFLKLPKIFLRENDILYLFDFDLKIFQKFFEPIKGFEFSPDGKKMVYYNNYEIWVLFLEEKYDQPQKKTGDKIFLTRFSEKIGDCFWYTSDYLIFNVNKKIKIAEIDDRDRINIYDLVESKEPKIFFNQFDKKLYILSEEKFLSSEKLLP